MGDLRIPYRLCDGFKLPYRFPEDRFSEAVSYTPKPDDLFLVSYPKTGSTWIQYVVYLILNDGKSPDDVESLIATTPYVQRDGFPSNPETPVIALKYQMPFRYVPYSKECKYIYIARNPKDTCISFYHFCKSVPGYNFERGTWDEFFELFLEGDLPFGSYFENLTSWYEHKNEPNFLFVTYEEMKLDLKGVIEKVATFLKKSLEEEVINNIVHFSSFQYMKEHVNSHLERYLSSAPGSWKAKSIDSVSTTSKKGSKGPELVRKGEVGQWKYYFSPEQNQRMNHTFLNETAFTNAKDLWPNIMTSTNL